MRRKHNQVTRQLLFIDICIFNIKSVLAEGVGVLGCEGLHIFTNETADFMLAVVLMRILYIFFHCNNTIVGRQWCI